MIKVLKRIGFILACLALFGEVLLRVFYGFGNPPLFEKSAVYGYRFVPNQEIVNFQKRLFFNASGLRSEEMAELPGFGVKRILCVGDSITYGGRWLDQNDTYPYQLQALLNQNGKGQYEVLNASAPSWAISNEEAYLKAIGVFQSQWVILQIGTTDLFQPYSDSSNIGKTPDYPIQRPYFAIQEIVSKWGAPYLFNKSKAENKDSGDPPQIKPLKDIFGDNLKRLENISNFVRAQNANFMIIYIPSLLAKDQSEIYQKAESEMMIFLDELKIPYLNLKSILKDPAMFRDGIHPNEKGNEVIAQEIVRYLESHS